MMNKNILLNLLAISLLGGACARAQVEKMPQNSVPPPTSPSPVSQIAPVSTPTPELLPPTSEDVSKVLKEATDKLGIKNAQVTTLDTQPPEIIALLAQSDGDAKDPQNLTRWAEKMGLVVGERDLNHDGTPEKFIVIFTDILGNGNGNANAARIFQRDRGKWQSLAPPFVDGLDAVKFVPTGKKGEFDIMRFSYKVADVDSLEETFSARELKKWENSVDDYKVINGKYTLSECRLENGKAKKIYRCPEF